MATVAEIPVPASPASPFLHGLADVLARCGLDPHALRQTHPFLFANQTLSLRADSLAAIDALIAAIEAVIASPAWQDAVWQEKPERTRRDDCIPAVCMGYDFHLDAAGMPWLIEINTNAGGLLLNACLLEAADPAAGRALRATVLAMFQETWRQWQAGRQAPRPLARLAIVDDAPGTQYLAPEFMLFQQLFAEAGISAVITDPASLVWHADTGTLHLAGEAHAPFDLIYNRLTDFYLTGPTHGTLSAAWQAESVAITPHPLAHARYADKRHLVRLSDDHWLREAGIPAPQRRILRAGIPPAFIVRQTATTGATQTLGTEHGLPEDALWSARKSLFFKPTAGYGSRAVYRGDKLTRKTFTEILAGDYIAQTMKPPGVRPHLSSGTDATAPPTLKFDLRAYVFAGKPQCYAARLYQGQTTNFRTPGGGFALCCPIAAV
jgi:hypothetical protein